MITKIDQVSEDYSTRLLPYVKTDLLESLGIGDMEERLFVTSLYCNRVTPGMRRHPGIDETMCKLWKGLLAPEISEQKLQKKGFTFFKKFN